MRFSLITFDKQGNVIKKSYSSNNLLTDCPTYLCTLHNNVPFLIGTIPSNKKYTRFDIKRQLNQELKMVSSDFKAIAVHKIGEWCKQQSMLYKLYLLNKGQ